MSNIDIHEDIIRAFSSCNGLNDKYITILMQASFLPPIPTSGKTQTKELFNCQNTSRFYYHKKNNNSIVFFGDSDSHLIKGLMSILFSCINTESNIHLTRKDIDYIFEILGIEKQYKESLAMGFSLIIDEVFITLTTALGLMTNEK